MQVRQVIPIRALVNRELDTIQRILFFVESFFFLTLFSILNKLTCG
jgi:hypothetical protein